MEKFVFLTPPENFSLTVEIASCFCQLDDKILLLQRKDEKVAGGRWGIPAGKVDKGEIPVQAVKRELQEETGIVLDEKDFVFFKKVYVRYPQVPIDYVCYVFKTLFLECPANLACNVIEHQALRWVTPQEALKLNLIVGQSEIIRLMYHGI